jgi:hypothetical protein
MAEKTIGCSESVKNRVKEIKSEYETWDSALMKLVERYENTTIEDEVR